jgi:DNA polymerase III subunit delta
MVAESAVFKEMGQNPQPCYLLSGDDSFSKEEFILKVKNLLPPELAGFNYDVFAAGDVPVRDIVSSALAYPFGSGIRVVLVKECGNFKKDEQKQIETYLRQPAEHTVLLLDFDAASSLKPFYKKLASYGRQIKFRKKKRGETAGWLKARAGRAGKKLSQDALDALLSAGGDNLRVLASELDKLCIQAGGREEITGEDAVVCAGRSGQRSSFELGSAISRGDCAMALRILADIKREAGAVSEMILGAIAWHFRSVWKTGAALKEGVSPSKIPSVCGIPYFRAKEFVNLGRKYSDEILVKIFREILQTDITLKTRQSGDLYIELLVVKLCGFYSA